MSINGQKLSGSWVTTEPKGMPGAVEAPIPWLLSDQRKSFVREPPDKYEYLSNYLAHCGQW